MLGRRDSGASRASNSSISDGSRSTADSMSDRGGSSSGHTKALLLEVALSAIGYYILYQSAKHIISLMDPNKKDKASIDKAKKALSEKLNRPEVVRMDLSEYEKMIADETLDPDQIEGGFDMIGGLEQEKKEIFELAVLPLKRPDMFNRPGSLLASPKGLLFYGAPGTGKTMLAKAIAKESGAAFINVRMSTLMNKYFGESNKLVAAVFSLAYKIAPSIIFIDEIDSFLRQRGGNDEAPWVSLKAEFMTLWDGILTDSKVPIMVLGATNRPYDLDPAILRRLPRQFEISLPTRSDREKILTILLAKENIHHKVKMRALAEKTEGYSGSDLKEMCRAAIMIPVREMMPYRDDGSLTALDLTSMNLDQCRKVVMKDFEAAMDRVRPTGTSANEYQQRESDQASRTARVTPAALNAMLNLMLQNMMAGAGGGGFGGEDGGGRNGGSRPHPSDVE